MPGAEPGNSFAPAVGGGNSHQFCQQAQGEAGGAAEEHYQDGTPPELSQPEEGAEEKSGTQPLKELFAQTGATHGRTPLEDGGSTGGSSPTGDGNRCRPGGKR